MSVVNPNPTPQEQAVAVATMVQELEANTGKTVNQIQILPNGSIIVGFAVKQVAS